MELTFAWKSLKIFSWGKQIDFNLASQDHSHGAYTQEPQKKAERLENLKGIQIVPFWYFQGLREKFKSESVRGNGLFSRARPQVDRNGRSNGRHTMALRQNYE